MPAAALQYTIIGNLRCLKFFYLQFCFLNIYLFMLTNTYNLCSNKSFWIHFATHCTVVLEVVVEIMFYMVSNSYCWSHWQIWSLLSQGFPKPINSWMVKLLKAHTTPMCNIKRMSVALMCRWKMKSWEVQWRSYLLLMCTQTTDEGAMIESI